MSANPYIPQPPAAPFRPRVWPGVLLLAVVLAMLIIPALFADTERAQFRFTLMMIAPLLALGGGVAWWVGLARVGHPDRLAAALLFAVPALAFSTAEYVSLDFQPPMATFVFGVPVVLFGWVAALVVGWPLPAGPRRGLMYAALAAGWVAFGLVRIDGTTGTLTPELAWRWTKTPEDAILDKVGGRETVNLTSAVEVAAGDWAEFRGPNRDDTVRGVTLDADWQARPPKKLWEIDVGPGWGSFAVAGDRIYTLEQQGSEEVVLCLEAATGKMAWKEPFKYPAFFKEAISGAGPRSTPTVKDGKVYVAGATGMLHCLNAADGSLVWRGGLLAGTRGTVPQWGFASSPLVTRGLMIVYSGGLEDRGVTAFDAADGSIVWQAGRATHGYSSAQLATIGGVEQVLMLSNVGLESFDPDTGKVLWGHEWKMPSGNRSLQPTVVGEGDFLIASGVGSVMGTRRVKVRRVGSASDAESKWETETAWETGPKFSPYYNDGVIHAGHFYGFSGNNFVCVDVATGKINWDQGKQHGHGQVLLFADAGQLLVTSEYGKMFLVNASPEDYDEVASVPTVAGKMWNHAAYARGRLYVRSDRKAACFEMPLAK